MTDIQFDEQDILNHGDVMIFLPHVEHQKSSYKRVRNKVEFVKNAFDPKSVFRPIGRIDGRRMLICMLPQRTINQT